MQILKLPKETRESKDVELLMSYTESNNAAIRRLVEKYGEETHKSICQNLYYSSLKAGKTLCLEGKIH